MTYDALVLRVMLRLARRREAADVDAIALRLRGSAAAVRASMRRLDAGGWIERRGHEPPRLTITGLALAVAMLPMNASQRAPVAARRSRAA